MPKSKPVPLGTQLEKLIGEYSMPEVVVELVRLSRRYKEQLRREGNSEYQGWAAWDEALTAAVNEAAGPEEFDE